LHGAIDKVEMKPVVDLAGQREFTTAANRTAWGMVFRCNLDGSEVERSHGTSANN